MGEFDALKKMDEQKRIVLFFQTLEKAIAKFFYFTDSEEYYLSDFITERKEKRYNLYFLSEIVLWIIFFILVLVSGFFRVNEFFNVEGWVLFVVGMFILILMLIIIFSIKFINKTKVRKVRYKMIHYLITKKRLTKFLYQFSFLLSKYTILTLSEKYSADLSRIRLIEEKIKHYNSVFKSVFYYIDNFEILAIIGVIIAIISFYPGITLGQLVTENFIWSTGNLIFMYLILFWAYNRENRSKKREFSPKIYTEFDSYLERKMNSVLLRKELELDLQNLKKFLPYLIEKKSYPT